MINDRKDLIKFDAMKICCTKQSEILYCIVIILLTNHVKQNINLLHNILKCKNVQNWFFLMQCF